MLKNKMGITLIEMLATIVIIGIISGISYGVYTVFFAKADLKTMEMKEKQISKIIDTWYQTYKEIPIKEKNAITGNYDPKKISYNDLQVKCNIANSKLCLINFEPLVIDKKVNFKIDGDYYIFYYNNQYRVSYDYPKELIQQAVANFKRDNASAGDPLLAGSNEIDTSLLFTRGYLDKKPSFKYTLLPNGLVDRLINTN